MAERWLANMQANAQTSGNRYARASYESVAGLDESQPTVRRSANRRHGQFSLHVDTSPERNNSAPFRTGNERLYEAYNELHALAQEFGKTFDAPAILVVGHQTDGKSGTVLLTRSRKGPTMRVQHQAPHRHSTCTPAYCSVAGAAGSQVSSNPILASLHSPLLSLSKQYLAVQPSSRRSSASSAIMWEGEPRPGGPSRCT